MIQGGKQLKTGPVLPCCCQQNIIVFYFDLSQTSFRWKATRLRRFIKVEKGCDNTEISTSSK